MLTLTPVSSMVGMSSGNVSLTGHVHADLAPAGDKTAKAIDDFGATVEALLMKHNKKIIGNLFIFILFQLCFYSLKNHILCKSYFNVLLKDL